MSEQQIKLTDLCSQCGERLSAMAKIGTDDGWCTVCLDEAADSTDDLRSRLACVLEASYWDRPYDERLAAIRGMCDLTTNGMTPAPDGESTIRDVLLRLDTQPEINWGPDYYVALADVANELGIDLGRHQ